jgi:alcohol dehydrogenase (cytochrome c)
LYVLDRVTGEFLLAKAFVKQNWNVGFEKNGRPLRAPESKPSVEGTYTEPGTPGGTNWYSPSFSPRTGLFYVSTWDNYSVISKLADVPPCEDGKKYTGRAPSGAGTGGGRAGAQYRTEAEGYGAVRAIDPQTGHKKWDFKMVDYTESGILTTASDLLFSGGRKGTCSALDARNSELLWKVSLGGTVASGPITFAAGGRQYVAVCAEEALYVFGPGE